MEQKDKELLLKDLCARLPYGVKVKVTPVASKEYEHIFFNATIVYIDIDYIGVLSDNGFVLQQDIVELKPYLFPMSSMTKEQKRKLDDMFELDLNLAKEYIRNGVSNIVSSLNRIDWLNANHFDYRGLIPMGLANDATKLNIY